MPTAPAPEPQAGPGTRRAGRPQAPSEGSPHKLSDPGPGVGLPRGSPCPRSVPGPQSAGGTPRRTPPPASRRVGSRAGRRRPSCASPPTAAGVSPSCGCAGSATSRGGDWTQGRLGVGAGQLRTLSSPEGCCLPSAPPQGRVNSGPPTDGPCLGLFPAVAAVRGGGGCQPSSASSWAGSSPEI